MPELPEPTPEEIRQAYALGLQAFETARRDVAEWVARARAQLHPADPWGSTPLPTLSHYLKARATELELAQQAHEALAHVAARLETQGFDDHAAQVRASAVVADAEITAYRQDLADETAMAVEATG